MRGFALLFRRDVVQRIPLFIASFAMGLFNACVPFLPGTNVPDGELRGAAGLITALSWAAVLALLFGGSIFTRDLTENRLAFDFRLPVRPGAIWAARLLAAIVTIGVAAGLVLAPSAVAGMDLASAAAGLDVLLGVGAGGQGLPARTGITLAPLAILALLLLANPIALASRARQAWAGVDMISFALIGFAGYWSWQTLRPWEAHSAIWWTTTVLVGATFVGTTVASLLQVVRGRTETDRAQKRLSTGLLATALLAAGVVTGYSQWLVHPNLNDLVGIEARAQSLGPDWVVLQGPTRSDHQMVARFLVAPATGRVHLLGPLPQRMWERRSVASSIDGSVIAWLDASGANAEAFDLYRLSTTDSRAKPEPTPVTVSSRTINLVLSPDGSSIATLERLGGMDDPVRLVVSKVASGDVTAAVQLPSCRLFGDMLFASSKELLVPCGFPSWTDQRTEVTRVVRVDLHSKSSRDERYDPTFPPALDASLGLVRTPRGWLKLETSKTEPVPRPRAARDFGLQTAWRLRSDGSDRPSVDLTPPDSVPAHAWVRGSELHDGTLVMAISGGETGLVTYAAGGQRLRTISTLGGMPTVLAESSDSATLLVGNYGRAYNGAAQFSFVTIDLQSGTSRALEKGLHPAGRLGEIGSTHSVLYDSSGRLLWFNPETKMLQPLLSDRRYSENGPPKRSSS
jgi:hypothetical protein